VIVEVSFLASFFGWVLSLLSPCSALLLPAFFAYAFEGEEELARVLGRVYAAMRLPFRPESVGSLRRAGSGTGIEEVIDAFAAEATPRYGAVRVPLDGRTPALARGSGGGLVGM
jgi:hypothetical protein